MNNFKFAGVHINISKDASPPNIMKQQLFYTNCKKKEEKRGKKKTKWMIQQRYYSCGEDLSRRGADEPGKSDKMIPEWWPTPDWVVQDAQIHHSVHRTTADRDATIKIATDKWVKHHCLWNQWPYRRLGKNDDDRRRRNSAFTRWNENMQKPSNFFIKNRLESPLILGFIWIAIKLK